MMLSNHPPSTKSLNVNGNVNVLDSKSFIDSTFPTFDSLIHIPDTIDKLTRHKDELQDQLAQRRTHGRTGGVRLAHIHQAGTQALTQLVQMEADCATVAASVRKRLMTGEKGGEAGGDEGGEEWGGGESESGSGDTAIASQVVHELRAYTVQVQQLEQARKYLVLLLKIQELDLQVRSIIARIGNIPTTANPTTPSPPTSPTLPKSTHDTHRENASPPASSSSSMAAPQSIGEVDGVHDALLPFLQLTKVQEVLDGTTQGQLALKEVLNKKLEILGYDLASRSRSAFKAALQTLDWPSPISIAPSKIDLRTPRSNEPPLRRSTAADRHADNPELLLLGKSFTDLLVLQSSMQQRRAHDASDATDGKGSEETLWVMDIMLEPIIKRFRYHFSGKKATNRLDKPEWPLHHAKKIVQEHTAFLSLFIQNLLLEEGSRVDAKTEFVKGLMVAINAKFRRDMGQILADRHLLFHTVKELLAFEKHMRSVHAYPVKEDDSGDYVPSSPSLPTCLDVLEDHGVFDLWLQAEIDLGVESLYAHLSAPGAWEIEDTEEYRAAKCAHMLLALLHSFTERFRYIKAPTHQLDFFQSTQHRLLEIFLKEVAVWREWKDWKDWREWWGSTSSTTSARWIEMMEKWCIFANSLFLVRSAIKDWSDSLFFLLLYKMKLEQSGERSPDSDAPLVGSIFVDILKQYKSLLRQFLEALITNISSAFKRATTLYLKRKKVWSGPQESVDISPELCVGLEDLAAGLRRGAAGLAPNLFSKVWRGVAQAIDLYVLDSLLPPSSNAFASGGTAQFTRDMHALFLLFRPYSSHPDNHFRSIKDVLAILQMPQQESKLLLVRLESKERDREREHNNVLLPYGITKISEEDAMEICRSRVC